MGHLVLERLDRYDLPAAQALLEACREHFVLTTGRPVSPTAARALHAQLPDGVTSANKYLLGLCEPDTRELIGLIDAVAHYPDAETLTVGLLLISPLHAGDDVVRTACRLVERWAAERGMRRVRIAVHASSVSVLHFWQTAGFVAEAEPIRDGRRLMVVFEKRLQSTGPCTRVAPTAASDEFAPPPGWVFYQWR